MINGASADGIGPTEDIANVLCEIGNEFGYRAANHQRKRRSLCPVSFVS